jgi:threonine/homoserine/homoserine lactone efflux protein
MRMSLEQLAAFTIFALVTSITPGPNNVMLTATGANVGIRRGIPHVLGVSLGFALMLFLIAAGAGAAFIDDPAIMWWIRLGGIAMLLWLAWKIANAGRAGAEKRDRPVGFFEAVAFQWVNPKAWLICASAVGSFLDDGSSALAQAALFGGIFVVVGMPCMLAWLGFGAAMQRLLRSDRALRGFNMAMGVLLAATALVMF